MKPVLFSVLLLLACRVQAQIISVDPEKMVVLELINGETCSGRIIDADAQQLHLVGPKVNRLVPFTLLSEASRKDLNLIPHKPSEAAPLAEFQGLSSTRSRLKESQQELSSSNHSATTIAYPAYMSYPRYFNDGYPCAYRSRNGSYTGGIFIHF